MADELYVPGYPGQGRYGLRTMRVYSGDSTSDPWPYLRIFNDDTTGSGMPSDISEYSPGNQTSNVTGSFVDGSEAWSQTTMDQCLSIRIDTQGVGCGLIVQLPGRITVDGDWNFEVAYLKANTIERGSTTMLIRQDTTNFIWSQHATYEGYNTMKNRVSGVDDGTYLQSTTISSSDFLNHYVKHRIELRLTGNSRSYFVNAYTGSTIPNANNPGEFPWETVMAGLNLGYLAWNHNCSVSSGNYIYVARIYAGRSSSGWPSDN